ncbi:MAG: polymer-forming cytoskeletal protein [Dysgonamonadaceae bacterium]|jgi:cytoskeletal protein CcmA (bactofilin family)|nr:polymer-forming cytoskeletal protein [Dysgonamonadaceae bacterium]
MKNKEIVSSGIAHNALASGTLIKGDIYAEEDLRIDGKVEGLIECAGRVVIGPQADVRGDLYCSNADIIGRINGNMVVKEILTIKESGVFTGDLTVSRLEITPGAVFNGTCKMQ